MVEDVCVQFSDDGGLFNAFEVSCEVSTSLSQLFGSTRVDKKRSPFLLMV